MGAKAPRWLPLGAAAIGGALVGALGMNWWNRGEPTSASPSSYSWAGPATGATEAAARELEMRRLLREELSRHAAAPPAAQEKESPPPPDDAPAASTLPPETVVHVERAHALLDAAIARLSWTREDASSFGDAMASVPPAERLELLRKFAAAVNERGMRLETGSPPL